MAAAASSVLAFSPISLFLYGIPSPQHAATPPTFSAHVWPAPPDSPRIRYIGASDGFAFTPGQGPLRITHDAGATWINVDTPFVNVYDLAILRGMIYVVGMPPKNTGSFGIWSTPTGHIRIGTSCARSSESRESDGYL